MPHCTQNYRCETQDTCRVRFQLVQSMKPLSLPYPVQRVDIVLENLSMFTLKSDNYLSSTQETLTLTDSFLVRYIIENFCPAIILLILHTIFGRRFMCSSSDNPGNVKLHNSFFKRRCFILHHNCNQQKRTSRWENPCSNASGNCLQNKITFRWALQQSLTTHFT